MNGRESPISPNEISRDPPLSEVSRALIARRLAVVSSSVSKLRQKSKAGSIEAKDVHQLRVGVRRTSAALAVIEPLLENTTRFIKLKKRLKKLRRALGDARGADVALAILAHEKSAGSESAHAAIDILTRHLRRRRHRALGKLDGLLSRYRPSRFSKWTKRVSALLRSGSASENSFRQAAAEGLRGFVHPLLATREEELTTVDRLHDLRLAGKHLRYGMEFFSTALDPLLVENAGAILVKLQDRLGTINDLHEIIRLIDARAASHPDAEPEAMCELRRRFTDRLAISIEEFHIWWSKLGHQELEEVFDALIERSSRFNPDQPHDEARVPNRAGLLQNGSPAA